MIKVGDILYSQRAIRNDSGEIMIGLKVAKLKVTKVNKITFECENTNIHDKLKISDIGNFIFITRIECIKHIINETRERLAEIEQSREVIQYKLLPKNIKKYEKLLKLKEGE